MYQQIAFDNNELHLNFLNFPTEIIVLILSELEIKCMLNCKLVCNKLNSIIIDNDITTILIDSQLKRIYKQKYLPLKKFYNLNFDIFKKIKINYFIKFGNNFKCDYQFSSEIIFTRLFHMFDLKSIISKILMHPPHKLSFMLLYKINNNNDNMEKLHPKKRKVLIEDEYFLREIENIKDEFYIFPNKKEINLFVNRQRV